MDFTMRSRAGILSRPLKCQRAGSLAAPARNSALVRPVPNDAGIRSVALDACVQFLRADRTITENLSIMRHAYCGGTNSGLGRTPRRSSFSHRTKARNPVEGRESRAMDAQSPRHSFELGQGRRRK